MSNKQDGGPAFPISGEVATRGRFSNTEYLYGMSLRDYFAASALTGYVSHGAGMTNAVAWSYETADKMLKQRELNKI